MKRKDDSLEWHDENELVRKLDVVEAVLNLADTIDDVIDVIMSVPNSDAPYIDIETGILHWHGWKYRRIGDCRSTADTPQTDCETCKHYKLACELFSEVCKYEPITQTETQNSNLTFENRTILDCYNCKRYKSDDACVECRYEPIADTPQTDCGWGEPK